MKYQVIVNALFNGFSKRYVPFRVDAIPYEDKKDIGLAIGLAHNSQEEKGGTIFISSASAAEHDDFLHFRINGEEYRYYLKGCVPLSLTGSLITKSPHSKTKAI